MNVVKFLKEVKEETRKVNWPTRGETLKNAVIVLITSFAIAIYLGAADYMITNILERVI